MNVVFRVDASIQMGTGHVMRCLTLADALKNQGAECYFICREHPGNLIGLITQRGYHVDVLPYMDLSQEDKLQNHNADLAHASWLGTTQKTDASLCTPIMEALKPDWLIVDHYALDVRWEKALHPYCKQIMVTGGTAPWIKEVRQQAQDMPWTTEVVVGVNNMAELMAKSDLAIGAAGSTSWERCCLGLPSIMVVLADNQNLIAKDLHNWGGAISIQQKQIEHNLPLILNQLSTSQLKHMQCKALQVTEGLGVKILLSYINSESHSC